MGTTASREDARESNEPLHNSEQKRRPQKVRENSDETPDVKRQTNNRNLLGQKNKNNNNNGENNESNLDNDMHFITDTFESAEKMKETSKRTWRRRAVKEQSDNPVKPQTASAPSRLTAVSDEKEQMTPVDPVSNSGGGLLARGKQFLMRGRPATRQGRQPPPKTAAQETVPVPVENDEWEYQKVAIEGFDPEKFKKANVNKKSNRLDLGLCSDDNSLTSLPQHVDPLVLRIRKAEKQRLAIAPAYDLTEEQLMKSIEKEFN